MTSAKSVFAPQSRVTLRAVHFTEHDEVVIRIFSERGSIPIILRENGKEVSNERVGAQLKDALGYFVPVEVYGENGEKLQ